MAADVIDIADARRRRDAARVQFALVMVAGALILFLMFRKPEVLL